MLVDPSVPVNAVIAKSTCERGGNTGNSPGIIGAAGTL